MYYIFIIIFFLLVELIDYIIHVQIMVNGMGGSRGRGRTVRPLPPYNWKQMIFEALNTNIITLV
jgi:hypothetical protein